MHCRNFACLCVPSHLAAERGSRPSSLVVGADPRHALCLQTTTFSSLCSSGIRAWESRACCCASRCADLSTLAMIVCGSLLVVHSFRRHAESLHTRLSRMTSGQTVTSPPSASTLYAAPLPCAASRSLPCMECCALTHARRAFILLPSPTACVCASLGPLGCAPLTRPLPFFGEQKIRTIELDGKTIKLQIVTRAHFPHAHALPAGIPRVTQTRYFWWRLKTLIFSLHSGIRRARSDSARLVAPTTAAPTASSSCTTSPTWSLSTTSSGG